MKFYLLISIIIVSLLGSSFERKIRSHHRLSKFYDQNQLFLMKMEQSSEIFLRFSSFETSLLTAEEVEASINFINGRIMVLQSSQSLVLSSSAISQPQL